MWVINLVPDFTINSASKIGTFRLENEDEDEDEDEDEIWLPDFSENSLKIYNSED